jgi:hypothetical protein
VTTQPIGLWRGAAGVAAIEAAGLVVYCIALAVAALNSQGATVSAPVVEIIIYLIFAAGIGLIARGMGAARSAARPPYLLAQVFVLIVAYTLFVGDGSTVKAFGIGIGILGIVGMAFGILTIIKEPDREPS